MQFFHITSAIAIFGGLVSGMPTMPETTETEGTMKALGQATVRVYRSDSCSNEVESVSIFQGGYRCLPYNNVRSVLADNSGCTVRTWSGNNCRGNSYTVRGGCNSVLFASVSIQC